MLKQILALGCLSLISLATQIEARTYIVETGHHWHDRVYYADPWYHPDHVYIYNGAPYATYYGGYPYYFYDPRFYFFN